VSLFSTFCHFLSFVLIELHLLHLTLLLLRDNIDTCSINLKSRGSTPSASHLRQTLREYAELVRPYGWVLQIYLGMGMVDPLSEGGWDWVKELGWVLVIANHDSSAAVD
jgi:hypothetical protein